MLALAKLAVQPNMHPLSSLITPDARTKITNNAYPVFASMTWAMVMYIFRWHPETLASSLRSSMVYMYVFLTLYTLQSRFLCLGSSGLLSPVLTFISTTVTATQTIGIPSALYLYTTNEISVGLVLLAFVCVTAYRAVVFWTVFLQDAFEMCTIPGPAHHYLFTLYYEVWDFLLKIFDHNINLQDFTLWRPS
jgi:hypothetical protein